MSPVTKILGVVPKDTHYDKMLQVFDACKNAGIACPEEVTDFFNLGEHDDDEPPRNGMETDLLEVVDLVRKEGDEECIDGATYDIDLSRLPDNIVTLRVKVYYC